MRRLSRKRTLHIIHYLKHQQCLCSCPLMIINENIAIVKRNRVNKLIETTCRSVETSKNWKNQLANE